jgi:hypothetical protein
MIYSKSFKVKDLELLKDSWGCHVAITFYGTFCVSTHKKDSSLFYVHFYRNGVRKGTGFGTSSLTFSSLEEATAYVQKLHRLYMVLYFRKFFS